MGQIGSVLQGEIEGVRKLGIGRDARDRPDGRAGRGTPDVPVDVERPGEADFLDPVAAILRQGGKQILIDRNIARGDLQIGREGTTCP